MLPKLNDNTTYVYRVKAVTFNGAISKATLGAEATTKPRPKGAINLKATKKLPKKVHLTWEASPTKDILKYKIYRGYFENASYSEIGVVDKDVLEYIDKVEKDGKKMFYKVTAVDKDALETSLNITAVMGQTLPPPKKPKVTLAQIQDGKVILNWEAGDNRAKSYIVYKTISRNFFDNKTLKYINITDKRFEDKEIEANVKYKYTIQAIDENNIASALTPKIELELPKEEKPVQNEPLKQP
jgi:fibronectin type 3 domain-containing protein